MTAIRKPLLFFLLILIMLLAQIGTLTTASPDDLLDSNPDDLSGPVLEPPDPQSPSLFTNSISGFLWIDGNGFSPTDWNGFYDTGESPLSGYTVSLYTSTDLTTPLSQTQTKINGKYIFENLESGSYVLGLASSTVKSTEYLLPMAMTSQNKFAIDWSSDPLMAYTGIITLVDEQDVEGIDAGMRLPMGVVPTSGHFDILLDNPGTGEGWTSSGNNVTFTLEANGNTYTITQTDPDTALDGEIIFPNGVNDVTVTIDSINILGNITLQDNAELNLLLNGTNTIVEGIRAPQGTTITIDSADSTLADPGSTNGSLLITSSHRDNAGIGGGNGTANPGALGSGGNITINGGTVNATRISGYNSYYNGAGIGGGNRSSSGNITINGGMVDVIPSRGAGIGGGNNSNSTGGDITITGGTVTAASNISSSGAGIGGGQRGTIGNITITGGTVTAINELFSNGSGIGGGEYSTGGNITITGGTVTAIGYNGSAIGGGNNSITLPTLNISSAADITAFSRNNAAINVSGNNLGNGFYVNAKFNKTLPIGDTTLKIYAAGDTTTPLNELLRPAGYTSFAYTTGSTATQANHILAYDTSDGSYFGYVV